MSAPLAAASAGPPLTRAHRRWPRPAGLAPVLACAGLLALWQGAATLLGVSGLPPASEALRELPTLLGDPEVLAGLAASLRRMAEGFALAVAVSVPLGLVMGRSRAVAAMANPLLAIAYPVPKAALMPLIMLWLGVGEASKLLVIALGVSLSVIYHSYQGARGVEPKMIWSAAAMGLGPAARLLRVVLPAALPEILIGCRTGIVLALITMITSEMIARQTGAGNILFNALDMAQYETVYAMILVVGALGVVLDVAFEAARRALTGWAEPRGADAAALGGVGTA